ncbi:RNA polymerase sigma factor [Kribbella sancticallisti]|uniref:RNA polymerase sigma factor n=1 Tax=Kribbella sancticallisti TaxID=460087 RepID=UPI0031D377DA
MRQIQLAGPDHEVWELLRTGDETALAEIFYRHSDAVYNFAFRRTSSWAAAEDVVQATFLAVWRRARDGRIDAITLESARPLLLVMAGYECGNVLRAARRQKALRDRIELIDQTGTVPDHAGVAASKVDDERAMSDIRRILDKIPAKQREVVELVIWAECSLADAARALGIPEGTVKSRLARARGSLAGLLDLSGTEAQA